MISIEDVDAAVEYLRSSAKDASQARANVKYLLAYLKTLKATLKTKFTGMSNAAAEDQALASREYTEALNGYNVAVEKDSYFQFMREAADAKIRAWQTQQATARSEGRAYQ